MKVIFVFSSRLNYGGAGSHHGGARRITQEINRRQVDVNWS